MSHTAMVEFPCNPGKGKELVETLAGALVDTRAYEGCESIEVYLDSENPDTVILWEKWAKPENYQSYLNWRIETGLMELLAGFMDTEKLRIANLAPQDA